MENQFYKNEDFSSKEICLRCFSSLKIDSKFCITKLNLANYIENELVVYFNKNYSKINYKVFLQSKDYIIQKINVVINTIHDEDSLINDEICYHISFLIRDIYKIIKKTESIDVMMSLEK